MKKHTDKYGHKIALITHEATTGPAHDLRDFLVEKGEELLFVAHPLLFIPANFKKSSYWQLYKNGKKVGEGKASHYSLSEFVLYVKDVLYSFFWVVTKIGKTDVVFGVGNVNAFVGVLLKKLGFTKKVVFYCIDYVPVRFQSKLVNTIYHYIDRWAVSGSDYTWNLSPRMNTERRDKWGIVLGNQITVPIGIWYERIAKHAMKDSNPHEIIYLGTILEKQGLDICIEAIQILREKIKDIKLTIIGSGPYEDTLKEMVQKYKLEKHVDFLGYIENHQEVEKRLSEASLAVALYNPHKDQFSYYADPGKVKSYLACGLPVLITDVPYIAQEVEKNKCGIIVEYDVADIASKIEAFLLQKGKTAQYKKNALQFAKEFDWNKLFPMALSKIFTEHG